MDSWLSFQNLNTNTRPRQLIITNTKIQKIILNLMFSTGNNKFKSKSQPRIRNRTVRKTISFCTKNRLQFMTKR